MMLSAWQIRIMLNEAPNSNEAMRVGNNVRLTAVGAQQFLMAVT